MLKYLMDFSNVYVLIIWLCLFVGFNVYGIIKKHSLFNLITLIFSVLFLIVHTNIEDSFTNIKLNILIDFISMSISIFAYLYIDDIEARRNVISEVFENKYKNKK